MNNYWDYLAFAGRAYDEKVKRGNEVVAHTLLKK